MDQTYFVTPFAALGDQTPIPIPTDPGGAVTMQQGWGPDYARDQTSDPLAKPIDRASTNYLMFIITQALGAIQATGIPQWITPANNNGVALAYPKYAQVRYSATIPGVTFETYVSTVDNNTSVPGADANWQPIASIVAAAADVIAGTSSRLPVTPLTLKSYPGNTAQTFNVATATAAGHAVPLAQAQALRGQFTGITGVNSTQTLTNAIGGAAVQWFGATGTLTLPAQSGMTADQIVHFYNTGSGVLTVARNGTDTITGIGGGTSFALQPGDDATLLVKAAAGSWDLIDGSAKQQFYPLTTAGLSGGGGAQSSTLNVRASCAGGTASVTFAADEIVLESALGGTSFKISGYSQTLNISGTGAGGMDTGSAALSTATSNAYLAVYAARNPTTGAVTIFSQNEPTTGAPEIYGGANAPAGFTQTKFLALAIMSQTANQMAAFEVKGRELETLFASPFVTASTTSSLAFANYNILYFPYSAKYFSGAISISNSGNSNTVVSAAGSVNNTGIQQWSVNSSAAGGNLFGARDIPIVTGSPRNIRFAMTTTNSGQTGTVSFGAGSFKF